MVKKEICGGQKLTKTGQLKMKNTPKINKVIVCKSLNLRFQPALYQQSMFVVVCDGVGNVFFTHFRPLKPVNEYVNAYLGITAEYVS